MPGAAGAYAKSTGKIYLNECWLKNAKKREVLCILTAEFCHHLDTQLNANDTPGDEGKTFASSLLNNQRKQQFTGESHRQEKGLIFTNHQWIAAEFESWTGSTIGENYPMQPMEMTTAATTISPAIAVTTPLMVALAMTLSAATMDTTLLMAEMEMTS